MLAAAEDVVRVGLEGKELTPAQLLERLGLPSSAAVDAGPGPLRRAEAAPAAAAGAARQPNVLILDEPSNDLDTDMLAALEDLLDSWPGTLLVVSHDRYLIERVTDQQYAILDGRLRHLPGGVDEYLRLRTAQQRKRMPRPPRPSATAAAASGPPPPALGSRAPERREGAVVDRPAASGACSPNSTRVDVKLAESHDDYSELLALQERRTVRAPRSRSSRSAGSS